MYKRKDSPKVGDYVIINIKEVSNISVKADLLEYENFLGIIPIDEIPNKYRFSRKNKIDVALVLDVDENNRIATLSLKKVNQNKVKIKIFEYKRERAAYNIIEIMKTEEKISDDIINKEIIDKIIYRKKLYEVFMDSYINGKQVLYEYIDDKKLADKLYEYIKRYFKVPKYELSKKIFMYTLSSDGINLIKNFLKKFEEKGFEVKYLGGGYYNIRYLTYSSKDIQEKEKVFNNIIEEEKDNSIYLEIEKENEAH